MALGLGLLAWMALLFAPLAFIQTVNAETDVDDYGTVIGIVSANRFRDVLLRSTGH